MSGRCVTRHLRYAWLEYEDARDAVQFDRVFSSCSMGWRNLFLDLPPGSSPGKRLDREHPNLDISFVPSIDNPRERGLIARPLMVHNDFLGKWVLNPGVNKTTGKLTYNADATDVADILSVSGHGYSGVISGIASGSSQRFEMAEQIRQNQGMTVSGRLKYVLIPACFNCSSANKEAWLTALRKPNPIHGVLGYSAMYDGNSVGAVVQHRFGQILQANPRKRILDAWAEANKAARQPWGAIILADAVDDTMEKWTTKGLSVPPGSTKVLHFDPDNYKGDGKGGREVDDKEKEITTTFVMERGGLLTPIGRHNNLKPDVGLFPGQKHSIRIQNNQFPPGFKPGEKIILVFYYYRPQKPDMDLDQMFEFRLEGPQRPTSLRKLQDQNVQKDGGPNKRFDAIELTLGPDNNWHTVVHFNVLPDAHKHHEKLDDHHGVIWVGIFPPGTDPSDVSKRLDMYDRMALLREPV